MVAGDHRKTIGERELCAVRKGIAGATDRMARSLRPGEKSVESNSAQAYDDAQVAQRGQLPIEPWRAIAKFFRGWLVSGRGAADDRSDPKIVQLHSIIERKREGLR